MGKSVCVSAQGGCLPRGVSAWGGSAQGGVHLTPWTEFLTDACENITFPQLLLRTVKMQTKCYLVYIQICCFYVDRCKRSATERHWRAERAGLSQHSERYRVRPEQGAAVQVTLQLHLVQLKDQLRQRGVCLPGPLSSGKFVFLSTVN